MFCFPNTAAEFKAVKKSLRAVWPAVSSGQMDETLARAAGFKTYASLLAARPIHPVLAIEATHFNQSVAPAPIALENLGYSPDQVERLLSIAGQHFPGDDVAHLKRAPSWQGLSHWTRTTLIGQGHAPETIARLQASNRVPVGLTLVVGETGQGKSTTLGSLLAAATRSSTTRSIVLNETGHGKTTHNRHLLAALNDRVMKSTSSVHTVEGPVECQHQVLPSMERDRTTRPSPFEGALRADPDVLMIGEIRDAFTADGVRKSVQAGHKVFSCAHGNNARDVLRRLVKSWGLSVATVMAPEFVHGLLYQFLLPVLCPHCALKLETVLLYPSIDGTLKQWAFRRDQFTPAQWSALKIVGPGCCQCQGTGYVGKTACSEWLGRHPFAQETTIPFDTWVDRGWVVQGPTTQENAQRKALCGLVSAEVVDWGKSG